MVGRQPEASSTSGVICALRNTWPTPVRTLVAVMNRQIGESTSASKSTMSARIGRSGWLPSGFRS